MNNQKQAHEPPPSRDAIQAMFNARCVAVVGASNDPKKYGCMTLRTLVESGFTGRIYPVNPKGGVFQGLEAVAALGEIPGKIDLVVVLVPARFVPGVLEEAGALGVKAAIVTSSGFSEMGHPEAEAEILRIARAHGMRLLGPNVLGATYLPNRLCAHFFPDLHNSGPVAMISQSGSLTNGLTEWLEHDGIGACSTVNLGNQADLVESDFLEYFAEDPNVAAVCMYLEGVKDGRRFLDALAYCTARKPVAILKAGRSAAGSRSAASHTGSMAGAHRVFEAACRQHGAQVAYGLGELYDQARALATLPVLTGDRILVISTSGGIGTLAVDEAEVQGLTVPELPAAMVEELKGRGLARLGNIGNPIDLAAIWAEELRDCALIADKYDVCDVMLLNFGDPVEQTTENVLEAVGQVRAGLAVTYLGGGREEQKARPALQQAGVAVFESPERAVRAIRAAVDYGRYRAQLARRGKEGAR
ncbi:acetate--CoA ligase family protein [Desulfococcus sp.]|uniref:acetate--CoA ligase family protein n=1 Tax=Desulfococcus sp. TaxID=2025834 RepID=UPI00359451E5